MVTFVWGRCASRFPATQLVVLLTLASESSKDARCYVRLDRLAVACRIKKRALQYCVQKLQKSGVLQVQVRKGLSNCYVLDREAIRQLPHLKSETEVERVVQPIAPLDPFGTSPESRM